MKTIRDLLRTAQIIVALFVAHYRAGRIERRLARKARHPNYIFLSGDPHALHLEESDRRFFVVPRRRRGRVRQPVVTRRLYRSDDRLRPIAEHSSTLPWWRR